MVYTKLIFYYLIIQSLNSLAVLSNNCFPTRAFDNPNQRGAGNSTFEMDHSIELQDFSYCCSNNMKTCKYCQDNSEQLKYILNSPENVMLVIKEYNQAKKLNNISNNYSNVKKLKSQNHQDFADMLQVSKILTMKTINTINNQFGQNPISNCLMNSSNQRLTRLKHNFDIT